MIDTSRRSLREAIDEPNVRFDAIVDFTSRRYWSQTRSTRQTNQGTFVKLTMVLDESIVVSPDSLVLSETEVVGSRYCSRYEVMRPPEIVASNDVEPVIGEVVD